MSTSDDLQRGIPQFGSKCVPLHLSLIVLWNTISVAVQHTQIGLGIGIPLCGAIAKSPLWAAVRPFWISAPSLIPTLPIKMVRVRQNRIVFFMVPFLPKSIARARQSVTVRVLIEMRLVDFERLSREQVYRVLQV